MIDHISIKDFAIIDNVEVDFGKGLSVITGETGSGKSIVVTAISLALGSRADSSYVRTGKEKAIIQISLTHHGEEIIISREIASSGKNLCRINGSIVTLSELAEKATFLADIHGQYDNQSLLNPDNHLLILDSYLKSEIAPAKESYSKAYNSYLEARKSLRDLLALETDNKRKEDFLRYELREIESVSPKPEEDVILGERLTILQNAEKIFEKANSAYTFINGDNGAYPSLGSAIDNLEEISSYSSALNDSLEETRELYYKLEDITHTIRAIIDDVNFSPDEIDTIIERLNSVDNLKRKYGGSDNSIEAVLSYGDEIRKELSLIENFDSERERLSRELDQAESDLMTKADTLTKARLKSAYELRKSILEELSDLGFESSDMEIRVERLSEPSPSGMDSAEIMITLNTGEPLKPLSKTSSGGEISRIMLALKKVISSYDDIPTLIFDEIDQGISGKTASTVGRKLREIAEDRQVISITHLPQIAAYADNGYRIYKESDENNTYTHVEKLGEEERILEIARLLAGETLSENAIENARDLVRESKV